MQRRNTETRLGAEYLHDEEQGLRVELPEQLLLYCYMDKRWIGGSHDGRYFLYIRRESSGRRHLPDMLIEHDLDIFLSSTAAGRRFSPSVEGKNMVGTIGNRWCEGYMMRLDLSGKGRYLILLADVRGGNSEGACVEALEVVERMLFAVIEEAPAT